MNKWIKLLAINVILLSLLTACSQDNRPPPPEPHPETPPSIIIDPDTPEIGWINRSSLQHDTESPSDNPYKALYSAEPVETIPEFPVTKTMPQKWVYVESSTQTQPFTPTQQLEKYYPKSSISHVSSTTFNKNWTETKGDVDNLYFAVYISRLDGYSFMVLAPSQTLRDSIEFNFDLLRIPLH